jgi:hypothetical protein
MTRRNRLQASARATTGSPYWQGTLRQDVKRLADWGSSSATISPRFPQDEFDQRGDSFASFDGVPKGTVNPNLVSISTTIAKTFDVASFFQVGDNPLDRSLSYSDALSNVTHPRFGILRNAKEGMSMIG